MKNGTKIALSGAIALSSLSLCVNQAHAAQLTNVNSSHTISQKAHTINDNNYMDKNFDLRKRCFALVGAAEDSETNYSKNYNSVSGDIHDGRGITAGIIGFTSGTSDMQEMLDYYSKISPGNPLDKDKANINSIKTSKLKADWNKAFESDHDRFVAAQNYEVKKEVMNRAVKYAKEDGLSQLGQYIYFDTLVKHGPGKNPNARPKDWSFGDIREHAKQGRKTPAENGDEASYLKNFVGKRYDAINDENQYNKEKHTGFDDKGTLDRLNVQMNLINQKNFDLRLPLDFKMNDTNFHLDQKIIDSYSDKDLASLN
ncbi:chitosanase [Staphylococcus chromogenes]|uniref:chitosanase n=1 Tax=Staphylococcus chromogenes TaxID=46126 RepID=UPI003D78BD0D